MAKSKKPTVKITKAVAANVMQTSPGISLRESWLPKGEHNLFQAIRAKRAYVQEQGIDLSIGEP